ncbi:hypothetical protein LH673_18145, partial [Morganella morganii]|uniref:hypothetical protein n=1 Tax=Morganella morganii TaxID=582 RepID=UPI001F16CB63
DKPIVFDDVERSQLSQDVIFGIISNYIETHNCHVIILMNNNEIKDSEQYKCLSEKTIGRVIKVIPEYNESYDEFISSARNKEILFLMKSKLISIFEMSKCYSLRILKRVVFEIDIICSCIDFEKNKNITKEIYEGLYVFTILSIAAKQGDINEESIKDRKSDFYYKLKEANIKDGNISDDLTVYEKVYKAHIDNIDISTTILNDVVLNNIIFNGEYERSLIIESIDYYQYINKNNEEVPWKTIYKFMQHSDSDILEAVGRIKTIIENRIYYPLQHILQFISALMFISDYVEYDFGEKGMEDYFFSYIDDLYEKEFLDIIDFSSIANRYNFDSCDHYGYYSSDKEQFKIIKNYLIDRVGELRIKKINEESQRILTLMKNDTNMLSKILTDESSEFLHEPLLSNINCDDFICILLDLDFLNCDKVTNIIATRVYRSFGYPKLDIERTWLNKTSDLLKIKIHKFSGIKRFRIQNAIDRFDAVFN